MLGEVQDSDQPGQYQGDQKDYGHRHIESLRFNRLSDKHNENEGKNARELLPGRTTAGAHDALVRARKSHQS